MAGRVLRWTARVGVAALAVASMAGSALAAPVWGPASGAANTIVAPEGSWNDGPPFLARAGGNLIATFDTDLDILGTGKGTFDGTGRYMGVYAVRSTNNGGTWSTPVRIDAGTVHAERGTLASNGTVACAGYMTQTKYYTTNWGTYTFDNQAVRSIFVRCSSNGGATWGARVKLPNQTATSRGDYPYMAASGENFYLVVTNSTNGRISLWRSTNAGTTWTGPVNVGTTTIQSTAADSYVGGYTGLPAVAADGTDVIVAWQTNTTTANGKAVARISTDAGATFPNPPASLQASGTTANSGYVNARSVSGKIVVTWTTKGGGFMRLFDTSTNTWDVRRQFATFTTTKGGMGAVPLLRSASNTIGMTWSECTTTSTAALCTDDYPAASDTGASISMVYRQSADKGATWGVQSTVQGPVGKYKQHNWGDGLFVGTSPYVAWNAHDAAYGYYNIQMKVCTGC
jgi:hypothetical protein